VRTHERRHAEHHRGHAARRPTDPPLPIRTGHDHREHRAHAPPPPAPAVPADRIHRRQAAAGIARRGPSAGGHRRADRLPASGARFRTLEKRHHGSGHRKRRSRGCATGWFGRRGAMTEERMLCPRAETLAAFAEGKLDRKSMPEILTHVEHCETCMAALTLATEEAAETATRESRPATRWLAVAALIAGAAITALLVLRPWLSPMDRLVAAAPRSARVV